MEEITKLANARKAAAESAAHKKNLMDDFLNSSEYQSAVSIANANAFAVEVIESNLKKNLEAAFDGNKKPHPAIQIKDFEVTFLKYDAAQAIEWCISHFTPALTLDKKKFDAACNDGSIPASIVTIERKTEHRVQIASDLSKYLE